MKRLVLSALAALSLAACASAPTRYQPATGPNAIGYSEYRIEPGRYRITFRGGSGPAQQVMDYALIRAADLALAEGYDWFRVSDRYMTTSGRGYGGPRISLGVGGADFGRHSAVGVGVGTGFNLGGGGYGDGQATAVIEVFMGRGRKPAGVDVYDARAVRSTLGRPA